MRKRLFPSISSIPPESGVSTSSPSRYMGVSGTATGRRRVEMQPSAPLAKVACQHGGEIGIALREYGEAVASEPDDETG